MKEESLNRENKLLENYSFEKKSIEVRFSERDRVQTEKIEKLDNAYSEVSAKKMELESEIKDFHTRLRIIDRDYVACQKELEKLKDENREMQKEKYDLERQNAALSVGSKLM